MVQKVKKDDLTTVYGTGASRFLPNGKAVKVHSLVARKLIAQGKATAATQGKKGK